MQDLQEKLPQGQQSQVVNDESTKSQPKTTAGIYIRHRQTSRLASRFHRNEDYDAENSIAEEFDDWHSSRVKLKNKSLQ